MGLCRRQTIKFRVQLRPRIYERERCARACARDSYDGVYFSEYCRERSAPNDCLSTALRSSALTLGNIRVGGLIEIFRCLVRQQETDWVI